MKHQVTATFLFILYTFIILTPLYPALLYHADKAYIAKNLCVNRDKPWLHCDGKCFLAKKLKDVFGDQQRHPKQTTHQNFKIIECLPCAKLKVSYPQSSIQYIYIPGDGNLYDFSFFTKIFHPPQNNC